MQAISDNLDDELLSIGIIKVNRLLSPRSLCGCTRVIDCCIFQRTIRMARRSSVVLKKAFSSPSASGSMMMPVGAMLSVLCVVT